MKASLCAAFFLAALASNADAQSLHKDRQSFGIAPQATTDPERIIYRVAGIKDTGSAENVGFATTFHCTNYGTAMENLRIRIFNYNGTELKNSLHFVPAKSTKSISTHGTAALEDLPHLLPGLSVQQGHAAIFATTLNIGCTVVVTNAADLADSYALHMTRYNPIPGTTE